jgi:uncharacterized protein
MIVDMRLRPPLPSFVRSTIFEKAEVGSYRPTRSGFSRPPSAEQRSMPLLLSEMDQAGVQVGVIMGRYSAEPLGCIPNDELAACVQEHPDRFVAWAGLDLSWPMDDCLREIDRCLRIPGFKGVSIEPSVSREPSMRVADDRRLYPIYEECQRRDIPVSITLSAILQVSARAPYQDANPMQVYQVALDFPKLDIHVAHAGWPCVTEMIGVAFACPRVWVSPDQYLIEQIPGADQYVLAANHYFADRTLFGSAYPAKPLDEIVAAYRRWPWAPGVESRVLGENALRLMRMA